tara:strand:+ start:468 stop:971 length:504 start_codon:yes stop_codon:yes gene_type:complete
MTDSDKTLAPFKSKNRKVKKGWIDYNGHMNVAFYTVAFDEAIDEFLENAIGIGPSFIKESKQGSYALQTQYRYLRELLITDNFYISIFVADFTRKRMHLMLQMFELKEHKICSTCETIMINVDLHRRLSCEYPTFAYKKLTDLHKAAEKLRSTTVIGQPIGLNNTGL